MECRCSFIARMDVGDVHLDDRAVEGFQRIEKGDGSEGEGGRVDDDGVGGLARRLHEIDQLALVVRLMEGERQSGRRGELPATGLDRRQRRRAVDMRLAHAQQIEVGAVENHYAGGHLGVPYAPIAVNGRAYARPHRAPAFLAITCLPSRSRVGTGDQGRRACLRTGGIGFGPHRFRPPLLRNGDVGEALIETGATAGA